MATNGLALTATASGCGKTLITLGLLAAMRDHGYAVCSAKSGPDYIDPGFHDAAGKEEVTSSAAKSDREGQLEGCCDQEVDQGQRQQKFPAKVQ